VGVKAKLSRLQKKSYVVCSPLIKSKKQSQFFDCGLCKTKPISPGRPGMGAGRRRAKDAKRTQFAGCRTGSTGPVVQNKANCPKRGTEAVSTYRVDPMDAESAGVWQSQPEVPWLPGQLHVGSDANVAWARAPMLHRRDADATSSRNGHM
jgi:hypothetical protein